MIRSTIARKAADVSARPRRCVMQAVRFVGVGRPAQLEDVPKPAAGPGQVLIKIGGAGVCHSDLHVMEEDLGCHCRWRTIARTGPRWMASAADSVWTGEWRSTCWFPP